MLLPFLLQIRYNETYAASEVSWAIVFRLKREKGPLNAMFTKDYIVGLVDGEGSFTAYVCNPHKSNKSKSKRRVKVEPRFYVKLVEEDRAILDELKKCFNCGNVYFQKDTRKNHQNCYRFEVTDRKHLAEIIIPFFKENKLKFSTKKRDFKIFCQIMQLVIKGVHLNPKGLEKIFLLKQKMH